MATTIPCPNPTCTHNFSLPEVQAAAQLLCPKCGFRMQGKAKPAAPAPTPVKKPTPAAPLAMPPKPAPPMAAPPKAAPSMALPPKASAPAAKVVQATPVAAQPKLASPVSAAPLPPMATPITAPAAVAAGAPPPAAPATSGEESIAEGSFFNPEIGADAGTLLHARGKPKRPFNWMKLVIILLAVGFAASIVTAVVVGVIWFAVGTGGLRDPKETASGSIYYGQVRGSKDGFEKVYKLALPKEDWEIDRDVLKGLEAHAAWKHKVSDFWFAVVIQDHGMFKPRDAEMLRIGIDRLEGFYGDALEVGKKAEPARIGDKAAQKIDFKGQIKAAAWSGECYMFFNNGIAYWLYIASPDKATVEYFAAELPAKNFFIESERRGWREQAPPTKTFAAANNKLTATGLEKVWDKAPNAKDIDENGVLYLTGTYMREKDNRKNASVLVFTFEKKDDLKDAMKAAREYLANRLKTENENYKLELAAEVTAGQTEQGTQENIGNKTGRIADLKRLFNDEPQRYLLLAVVNESDAAYGIVCDCTWDSRQIWRQDFLDLLRSMNFKKVD